MFYNLLETQLDDVTEFWKAYPLSSRIDIVRRGHPRLAWLYEKPDTSTFRYRCFNTTGTINAVCPDIGAAWFSLDEMPEVLSIIGHLDVLVVCRVRYDSQIARIISRSIASGTSVLFDCDDLVFNSRYVHMVMKTLDQPDNNPSGWDFWHSYIGRIEATAQLCQGSISTNSFLNEMIQKTFGYSYGAIVNNYLARDQENISLRLLAAKRERGYVGDGNVTIGYFSGTPTHNKDFAVVVPALGRLLASDPRTRLRIVGYAPPHTQLINFSDRIEVVPFQDHLNLQRLIAEVEINIAPLQDNEFTNCKSELKYFEAAAVGTWTVATPTHAFRQAIRDGITGRLAREHEWDQALMEAVDLVRDSSRYAEIAETAASECYSRYGWDKQAGDILAATRTGHLDYAESMSSKCGQRD